MLFLKKKKTSVDTSGSAARPELQRSAALVEEGRFAEALEGLSEAAAGRPDPALAKEMLKIRHLGGIRRLEQPQAAPAFVEPAAVVPPLGEQSRIPEVTPEGLSAEVVRAAILEHGALLVRGLLQSDLALRIADGIDQAFVTRTKLTPGEPDPEGYYDELDPISPYEVVERHWVAEGGGVLAADSPRLMFEMLDAFENAGLREVIATYLGEEPAISAQKCTLRKAEPNVAGGWHQDGKFLGDVRALNVWVSLSRCGDVAPSMDVVPRRLNDYATAGVEDAKLDFIVPDRIAREVAGDAGVVRPIFDPGDALLFDELFLHKTGSDPSMPNPRYAIESWFFGPSSYPDNYAPIAF